jgi:ribose transport system substrate-binding protein
MEKTDRKTINKYKKYIIAAVILVLGVSAGSFAVRQANRSEHKKEDIPYKYHYAFITKQDASLSMKIFHEAQAYGETRGAYVELLKEESFSEYGTEDYLAMAAAMKVDGIILEGEDSDSVREGVNRVADAGIPVITVLSDCRESKRQVFIELGDYNLGREFGRRIISEAKERNPEVVLLTHTRTEDGNQNMVYTGIKETLKNEGNHLDVQIRMEVLDDSTQFSAAVKIQDILKEGSDRPDMVICVDEEDTETVYQFLVDHSLVGKVKVIGCCVSDNILKAIQNGGIAATVDVDTEQMGFYCIDVLNDYIETGHVSDYIIVEANVVTKDNVERYLEDE